MILSLQLYSLRNFMDFEQSLQFCKAKGLSYVEPAGLYGLSAESLVAKLKQYELQAQSIHLGLDFLQENWHELAKTLSQSGTRDFVMPFADPSNLEEVHQLASHLSDMASKLQDRGIRLHYHNHSHEISRVFEGKCIMDWLLELVPSLYWQVDVGWVCAGGANVAEKMRQWHKRILLLHIKDILVQDAEGPVKTENIDGVEVVLSAAAEPGGQPARIGDGIVDFAGVFATAEELGISTFILENDNPEDPDAFADSGIALVQKYAEKNPSTKGDASHS